MGNNPNTCRCRNYQKRQQPAASILWSTVHYCTHFLSSLPKVFKYLYRAPVHHLQKIAGGLIGLQCSYLGARQTMVLRDEWVYVKVAMVVQRKLCDLSTGRARWSGFKCSVLNMLDAFSLLKLKNFAQIISSVGEKTLHCTCCIMQIISRY